MNPAGPDLYQSHNVASHSKDRASCNNAVQRCVELASYPSQETTRIYSSMKEAASLAASFDLLF